MHFIQHELPWLGGTDEGHEGVWLWEDGSPIVFTFWAASQPDNGKERWPYKMGPENCMVVNDIYSYLWSDSPCSLKQVSVCQFW